MGASGARAVVLDSGALIAFERNDRRVRRLVELAIERQALLCVPVGCVGQIWRNGSRQARIARLLASKHITSRSLDLEEAKAAGVVCGESGTADVVDASVVLLARRHDAIVVTSDPDDVRRIDGEVDIVVC